MMARPKDKLGMPKVHSAAKGPEKSVAFENRAKQELEKLTAKVAKALNDDILHLFEDGEHSDLIFTNGVCEVGAHRAVVQARAQHLWQDSWIKVHSDGEERKRGRIALNGLTEKQISDFVRQLYTVSDSTLLIDEYLTIFPHQAVEQGGSLKANSAFTPASGLSTSKGEEAAPSLFNEGDWPGDCLVPVETKPASEIGLCHQNWDERDRLPENCVNCCAPNQDVAKVKDCDSDCVECSTTEITEDKPHDDGGKHFSNHGNIGRTSGEKTDTFDFSGTKSGIVKYGDKLSEGGMEMNVNGSVCSCDEESSEMTSKVPRDQAGCCDGGLGAIDAEAGRGKTECFNIPASQGQGELEAFSKNLGDQKPVENEVVWHLMKNDNQLPSSEGNGNTTAENRQGKEIVQDGEELQAVCCYEKQEEGDLEHDSPLIDCEKRDNKDSVISESVETDSNIPKTGETSGKSGDCPSIQSVLSEAIKSSYSLSLPYEACSCLGRDLLRMYLQQENCDVCLCVDGIRFLTHKCVLAARSSYFSAMLGGKWCESQMEEIELQGVTAQALEQLLLFLYGGVVELCTPCDLTELFIIMDMYGVDSLRLVLEFCVRKDLCHFFHKPCSQCVLSAASALSLCHTFLLEDLEERCLKWSVKYFTKTWSNKAFASLPDAVHHKCTQCIIESMTEKSVLDTIMECNKLSTSLPRIKWTESILYLTTQLMDSAIEYTSSNFIKVIRAPEFLQWGKVAAWKAGALEEIFNSVIDSLPIDTACSAYQTLCDIKAYQASLDTSDQDVLDLLDTMVKRCEKFLKTHIHQVARSKQWTTISLSLQSQILENSSYIHFCQLPDPKPRPGKRPVPVNTRTRPFSTSTSGSSRLTTTGSSQASKGSRPTQAPVTSRPRTPSSNSSKVNPSPATHQSQMSPKLKNKSGKINSSSSSSHSMSLHPKSARENLSTKSVSSPHPSTVDVQVEARGGQVSEPRQLSPCPGVAASLGSRDSVLRRSLSPNSKLPVKRSEGKEILGQSSLRQECWNSDEDGKTNTECHNEPNQEVNESFEGALGGSNTEGVRICGKGSMASKIPIPSNNRKVSDSDLVEKTYDTENIDLYFDFRDGESQESCVSGASINKISLPPSASLPGQKGDAEVEGRDGAVDAFGFHADSSKGGTDDQPESVERESCAILNQETEFVTKKNPVKIDFIVPEY